MSVETHSTQDLPNCFSTGMHKKSCGHPAPALEGRGLTSVKMNSLGVCVPPVVSCTSGVSTLPSCEVMRPRSVHCTGSAAQHIKRISGRQPRLGGGPGASGPKAAISLD